MHCNNYCIQLVHNPDSTNLDRDMHIIFCFINSEITEPTKALTIYGEI